MEWLFAIAVMAGVVLLVRWARRQSKSRGEPPCGLPIERDRAEASASNSGARRTGEAASDCRASDVAGGDD